MILGYKFQYSRKLNSVSASCVHMAYKMVIKDEEYDLCEVLRQQILENIAGIKKNRTTHFRFGSLVMYISTLR